MMKLLALLPDVSVLPEQVLSVYGDELALTLKRSKNCVLARDLLLCSSSTAYILIAFSFFPAGYTLTKQILEQERELSPLTHISVQLEVTEL